MSKKVWVLVDDKVGNANQAINLAKCLDFPFEIKKIEHNFLGFLPNWLRFDTLIGIDLAKSSSIDEPYPDVIISSGRKNASVANFIKKNKPDIFAIHLMHPDLPFENFDLIALPLHDKLERYENIENIFYTLGSPSYISEEELKDESAKFRSELDMSKPCISLIIGGKTKFGNYLDEDIMELVKRASRLAQTIDANLLITSSRRTTQDIDKIAKEHVKVPYFLYDWSKDLAKDNPYMSFLSLSDYFIITADSVSMCSEALRTGKPVYLFKKNSLLNKKHIKFINYLEENGYIRNLNHTFALEKWNYEPLREAEKLAKHVREKLNANSNFSS